MAPKAGAACATSGATAKIAGKTFTCATNLGGKMVWMLKQTTNGVSGATNGTKPSIAGGGRGPGDEGSSDDVARHAAMKKYSDCLVAHGGTAQFFRGGPDENHGTPPSISPAQQSAMAACKAFAPKFGGPGIGFGGPRQMSEAQQTAMNSYITCLSGQGLAVKNFADLRGLNRSDAKVTAALTACQSKSPFPARMGASH